MEVLERPDGRLLVEHQGRTIPTQEAPPRPSLMRALSPTLSHPPSLNGSANGSGYHHHPLAALETLGANGAKSNRPCRARKQAAPTHRKPTPRQKALWEAVQEAKAVACPSVGLRRSWACIGTPPVTARPKFPVALADTMNDNTD